MADYMGHFQRHYVAPRATDQRKMNQQFQGKLYNLSERYTDMNKVVFLAFFYAGIFPMGFLYGAAALLVHYLVDKFCLLRVWKQAPKIGTELTNTSSRFMYVAVLAYVFSSTYSQSAFPYDNACEYQGPNTDNILKKYVGFHNLTSVDDSVNITSINDTKLYKFCNQDFIRDGFKFPFFPEYQGSDKWMTDDQETIVTIFAYTLLFVLGVSVVLYIRYLYYGVKTLFVGTYKPSGEASSVPFSFLHLPAYVPQNKIPDLVYPSFLCNIDDVPHKHIGWDPPRGSYDDHNLIYTVPGIDVGDDANAEKKNSMFSVVKYYPVEENED